MPCRCPASKLVMIGDRYLTDVVYGNRHGMLTIRPTPISLQGEPFAVRLVSSQCAEYLWCIPRRGHALTEHSSLDFALIAHVILLWCGLAGQADRGLLCDKVAAEGQDGAAQSLAPLNT